MTTLEERRLVLAHLQHGSNFWKKKHSVKQVMNRTKLQTLTKKLDDAKAEVLKWVRKHKIIIIIFLSLQAEP